MKHGFVTNIVKSLHKINKAEIGIKEKQYEALWSVVKDKNDAICVLRTGYGKLLIYQLLPFMFDFYPHCEDNDLSSSSSFVLVISPLNALMIDQITKLKDHVNVSIMKAVHVDESKDAMYSLREPLYMDNDSSKIIFAHAEALLEDKKVFQYLLKSKKYKDNLCVCVWGGGGGSRGGPGII